MPSQILHTLFGEDVMNGLNSGPSVNDGAFVLGCQGPDIFYHNRRTRPVAIEYGSLLHRRGYGTFCAQLLAMGGHDPQLRAYALGFMTHAILDRFCHPYIVYKSVSLRPENTTESGIYHPFFERVIDVLMLGELRRLELSGWNQKTLVEMCENPPQGVKELLVHSLTAVYPERTDLDEKLSLRIDNAFADSARYYRMSEPANTGREQGLPVNRSYLSLIFPLNLPTTVDFLNLRGEPWYYPYRPLGGAVPAADYRSFVQVYSDAVDAAVRSLLPCVMSNHIDTVAGNIGDGCLSIHDEYGRHCAPNCTSPLPLERVLQDQADLRNLSTNYANANE